MFYSYSSSRADCYRNTFAYGNSCRGCSDYECPIGQFRTMCTPHSDSYCKKCTNAPDTSYEYVTPGNDNDCEYRTNSVAADLGEFSSSDPASLVMFFELPVSESEFNGIGGDFRAAIANVAGVGTADKVKALKITEYSLKDVDDDNAAPTSSSTSSTSSSTSSTSGEYCLH